MKFSVHIEKTMPFLLQVFYTCFAAILHYPCKDVWESFINAKCIPGLTDEYSVFPRLNYSHSNKTPAKRRQTVWLLRSERGDCCISLLLISSHDFYKMPRDPYPFPRLQNDSDFYGQQGKQVREKAERCRTTMAVF